jgi:hypothetical protein
VFSFYALECSRAYFECDRTSGTMEYTISEHEGARVFAFRGTAKNYTTERTQGLWSNVKAWGALVRDVLADIAIRPWYDSTLGWRPAGFLRATNDVLKDIRPLINKSQPIDLTGHSLGGACAALLGEALAKEGYWVRNLTLFGCPRIGKLKHISSDNCSTKIHSFRFGKDIVTTVPPIWSHAVPLERIGQPSDALNDHAIDNYAMWFVSRERV